MNAIGLRAELQAIADKLNLPINDERVALAWLDGDAKILTKEAIEQVIVPLYCSKCIDINVNKETTTTATILKMK